MSEKIITKDEYNRETLELFRETYERCVEKNNFEDVENRLRISKNLLKMGLIVYMYRKEDYFKMKKEENIVDYFDLCEYVGIKPQSIDEMIEETKNKIY